jgi:hypothetical protein
VKHLTDMRKLLATALAVASASGCAATPAPADLEDAPLPSSRSGVNLEPIVSPSKPKATDEGCSHCKPHPQPPTMQPNAPAGGEAEDGLIPIPPTGTENVLPVPSKE